jgi:hypothetical protein
LNAQLNHGDWCLDAPSQWMKRLESRTVFIEAEDMASGHQVFTMPLHVTNFSRFRKSIRHISAQFHAGRLVGLRRNRLFTI